MEEANLLATLRYKWLAITVLIMYFTFHTRVFAANLSEGLECYYGKEKRLYLCALYVSFVQR